MKTLKELLEKRWFANTFALCIAVVLFCILNNLRQIGRGLGWVGAIFTPISVGVIIAYLLDPFVSFIEKKIFRSKTGEGPIRLLSVILGYLVCTLFIGGILVLLVPSIIDSAEKVSTSIPAYQRSINQIILYLENLLGEDVEILWKYADEAFSTIEDFVKNNAGRLVNVSLGLGGALFNLVIGIILSFYLLGGKKSIIAGMARLRKASISEKSYESQTKFLWRCHKILITFISYDVIDAIIVGVVNAAFMLIMKMPFIPLVSVTVGVTNLVPTFGPFIGAGLGAVILLFSNPAHSVIFLAFTLVLQIIDGYVLKPKLFGSAMGVPPVWVFISLVMGGNLFGIIGILLAIPFAAIFTFVYNEAILPALEKGRDKRAKNREERSKTLENKDK